MGQFRRKLAHYRYQRLAIRLRGAPATRDFRVVGMESRAFRQTFIALAMNPRSKSGQTKMWSRLDCPQSQFLLLLRHAANDGAKVDVRRPLSAGPVLRSDGCRLPASGSGPS